MDFITGKRLFLLDMDGTLYLGNRLFERTPEFLEKIKKNGGRYVFVTNNSSKSAADYVQKLAGLGIAAAEDEFFTSTEATGLYIAKQCHDVLFYVLGTSSFVRQLTDAGVRLTEDAHAPGIGGVLLSNDTELTFGKLYAASELLTAGVPVYLATNPDLVCPTEFGYVPDCGSFADALERATGRRPYFIGKPRPDMLKIAMEKYGCKREECLMVGDRLYTDIAAGVNAGMNTVFVLSGEGTLENLKTSDVRPTYVMRDVGELCDRLRFV